MENNRKYVLNSMTYPQLSPIYKSRKTELQKNESFAVILPPVLFSDMLTYAAANPYHARCIGIKSQNTIALYEIDQAELDFLDSIVDATTFFEFLEFFVTDYFFFGNAYVEIGYSLTGEIAGLYNVQAQTVYLDREKNFVQLAPAKTIKIPRFVSGLTDTNRIMHIKKPSVLSAYYGYPEWISILEKLRLEKNFQVFFSSFFKNGANVDKLIVLSGAEFAPEVESEMRRELGGTIGEDQGFKTLTIALPWEGATIDVKNLTSPFDKFDFAKIDTTTRDAVLAVHSIPQKLLAVETAGKLGNNDSDGGLKVFYQTVIKPEQGRITNMVNKILRQAGFAGTFKLKIPAEYEDQAQSVVEKTSGTTHFSEW